MRLHTSSQIAVALTAVLCLNSSRLSAEQHKSIGPGDLAPEATKSASAIPVNAVTTTQSHPLPPGLSRLDAWLTTAGENGKSWRSFLMLDAAEAEIAKDNGGNLRAVAESWSRFASGQIGLDAPQFAAARAELSRWWQDHLFLAGSSSLDANSVRHACGEAKSLFVSFGPVAVAADKQALESALKGLLGANESAIAARKTLGLAELEQQLASATPDPEALGQIEDRFRTNEPGLDSPPLADVREKLQIYRRTLAAAQANDRARSLAANKAAVAAAAAAYERYLNSESQGPAIKTELKWNEFQSLIAAADSQDTAWKDFQDRFAKEQPGLQSPTAGQSVANAIARYRALLAAPVDFTQLRLDFDQHLDGLANDFSAYLATPDQVHAEVVNNHLTWFVEHRQAGPLLGALRTKSRRPNFVAKVAEKLAAIGFSRALDDPIAIHDVILGTSIHGQGRTVGMVGVDFVPNDRLAQFRANLQATTATNTVGHKGPATIYATGMTRLNGAANIELDASGLRAGATTANATTSTQITGVATNGRCGLVQRIATKKVNEAKPQAERVSAAHASNRARDRLAQEVNVNVEKANQNFQTRVRAPLLRREAFPSPLIAQTSDDWLTLTATAGRWGELAAVSPPPAVVAGDAMVVELHESAVNNLAAAMLSGVTIEKEKMEGNLKNMFGSSPAELKDDAEPWSITFADEQPVVVSIVPGGFRVKIRGKAFQVGATPITAKDISVAYKVTKNGDGARLERDGEVEVFPPGHVPGKKYNVMKTGGQGALKRKLEERLFKKEIETKGLVLPGRWKESGPLPVQQLTLSAGWAVLGWGLPSKAPEAKAVTQTGAVASPAAAVVPPSDAELASQ